MEAIDVGFAKTDITPRDDPQTIYHRLGQPVKATTVRDRLYVYATAFRSRERTALWITADLIGVTRPLRDRAVRRLAEHGIRPEYVALSATHTHTAPTVVRFHGVMPTPESYLSFLESALVRTALRAVRSARPAELAFGRTTVDLSVNRRQIGRIREINDLASPTGLVDPDVNVARFRFVDDGALGCLFNYGAHPLTLGTNLPAISADYPGRAVEYLERRGSLCFAQFLQGSAGNLNVKIHGDIEEAEAVGHRLGEAVLTTAEKAQRSESTALRVSAEVVRLPWERIPTLEEARQRLECARATGRPWSPTLEWAEDLCRTLEQGPVLPYAETLVQAMRVGDAVFLALPGEVFVEIGLAIKRRAGVDPLFVVAYSNDTQIGYIPTASAFSEGGYEVVSAPYYYGLFRLSSECERILVEAGVRVVKAVT